MSEHQCTRKIKNDDKIKTMEANNTHNRKKKLQIETLRFKWIEQHVNKAKSGYE